MEQLPLRIVHTLSYSVEHFIVHQGIRIMFDAVSSQVTSQRFGLFYILGAKRSGKTHLSIALSDLVVRQAQRAADVRLLEGHELSRYLETRQEGKAEIVIVDCAEKYLETALPGSSGGFVALVESLRRAGGVLILITSSPVARLPCDEHILSRLRAGVHLEISEPAENEVAALVKHMAAQRGIRLDDRAVQFICKRTAREISEIEKYFERVDYLSQTFGKAIRFPLLGDAF